MVVSYIIQRVPQAEQVIAPTFEQIQPRIKAILQDKILIGHAVFNDLAVSYVHVYVCKLI
jgi:DNA polymerase III epsilon subunit-like protein